MIKKNLQIVFLFIVAIFICSCGQSPFVDDLLLKEEVKDQGIANNNTSITDNNVKFNIIWTSQKILPLEELKFLFIIMSKNGDLLNLKNLDVNLMMPSMGHGSYQVEIRKISRGIYEVSHVIFIMGGPWEIEFDFVDDLNNKGKLVWPIKI